MCHGVQEQEILFSYYFLFVIQIYNLKIPVKVALAIGKKCEILNFFVIVFCLVDCLFYFPGVVLVCPLSTCVYLSVLCLPLCFSLSLTLNLSNFHFFSSLLSLFPLLSFNTGLQDCCRQVNRGIQLPSTPQPPHTSI